MKICHVSFGPIKHNSPVQWLQSVPYFTKILTEISKTHRVVSVHYADVEKTISYHGVHYYFLKFDWKEKYFLNTVLQSVTTMTPDVIIVHGWHSIIQVYRFTRVLHNSRIFIQHHAEKCFHGPKAIVQRWVDKLVCGYFFSSSELGKDWLHAGLIAHTGKIFEVLETTSSFRPQLEQNERVDKLSFIWVGRLDENKDPMTMIEAFKAFLHTHPEAQLYMLFKTNELLPRVKMKINGFEKRIHLVGKVAHDEMPAWYAKVNYIVATSLFEGGGVSVLEAMALGCIPVLTDIPAFQRMTDRGRVGLLFPVKSPEKLAGTLRAASSMDFNVARRQMGQYFDESLSAKAIARQIIGFVDLNLRKV